MPISPVHSLAQRLAIKALAIDIIAVNEHQHRADNALNRDKHIIGERSPCCSIEEIGLDGARADGIHTRIDVLVVEVEGCDASHEADDAMLGGTVGRGDLTSVKPADTGGHDEDFVRAFGGLPEVVLSQPAGVDY